jgi:hypothetical protein
MVYQSEATGQKSQSENLELERFRELKILYWEDDDE